MPTIMRTTLALMLLALPAPVTAVGHGSSRGARAVHDMHLSYTRMVVDGPSIVCRVRVFKDDIQGALQRHLSSPAFQLAATPASDSAFAAYFNAHVAISSNGTRLVARVRQSSADSGIADLAMWSYLVELSAPTSIRSLSIRIGILFDSFKDQKNVVTVLKMPREERFSLSFMAGDSRSQTLSF
jgi:hypothetical protein